MEKKGGTIPSRGIPFGAGFVFMRQMRFTESDSHQETAPVSATAGVPLLTTRCRDRVVTLLPLEGLLALGLLSL